MCQFYFRGCVYIGIDVIVLFICVDERFGIMNEVKLLQLLKTEGAVYARCKGNSAQRLMALADRSSIPLRIQCFERVGFNGSTNPNKDCLVIAGKEAVEAIEDIHADARRQATFFGRDRLKTAFSQIRDAWKPKDTLHVQLD